MIKMDANLKNKIERNGSNVAQVLTDERKTSPSRPFTTIALVMLGMMNILGISVNAFTAHDCTNRSNIIGHIHCWSLMCALHQMATGN